MGGCGVNTDLGTRPQEGARCLSTTWWDLGGAEMGSLRENALTFGRVRSTTGEKPQLESYGPVLFGGSLKTVPWDTASER